MTNYGSSGRRVLKCWVTNQKKFGNWSDISFAEHYAHCFVQHVHIMLTLLTSRNFLHSGPQSGDHDMFVLMFPIFNTLCTFHWQWTFILLLCSRFLLHTQSLLAHKALWKCPILTMHTLLKLLQVRNKQLQLSPTKVLEDMVSPCWMINKTDWKILKMKQNGNRYANENSMDGFIKKVNDPNFIPQNRDKLYTQW